MKKDSGVVGGQRPFLKWAGNKFRILSHIQAALPDTASRLIEPFAGSGAVFVNTDYPNYLIAEKNPDLINLYQQPADESPNQSQLFGIARLAEAAVPWPAIVEDQQLLQWLGSNALIQIFASSSALVFATQ